MSENRRRQGIVRVSKVLIADFFGFPETWEIDSIEDHYFDENIVLMTISGPDFPEVDKYGEPLEVELLCHKGKTRYEVEIKK